MTPIVEIKNIVKHYDDVKAVNDISLSIKPGICFGLLGPNGAGKTTTIEIIEGIIPATSGEILYKGKPINRSFQNEVGIQFQATALQEFLTVKETLLCFKNLYSQSMDWDELVSLCALEELLERDNQKLSGGQRQRLLLALALVNDPQLVFLDEPTTGLDPQARRNFWDLIKLVRSRNKTIVLTTHYMDEANALCDEIVIVDKGQIIAQGTPAELLQNHFGDAIIQIPENDISSSILDNVTIPFKINGSWIEFQTHQQHETINYLLSINVSLKNMSLRTWSLEDLFISLTGKKLRQ